MPSFNEYYTKTIELLKSLSPLELTISLTKLLRELETRRPDKWSGKYPWTILIIIKWAWQFGGTKLPLKNLSIKHINKLLEYAYEMDGLSSNLFLKDNPKEGLIKFFRTLAYKQFPFQQSLGAWNIGRQQKLFGDLKQNDELAILFKNNFGLWPSEILGFLLIIWTWLNQSNQNHIFNSNSLFSKLSIKQESIEIFLSSFSLETAGIKKFLNNRYGSIENPFFQFTEQTPFIEYPMFYLGSENYLCFSMKIFEMAINIFFYSNIRKLGGNEAMMNFGEKFEKYVESNLEQTNIEFLDENELIRLFPDSKVTDFLWLLENANVFIEVKSQDIRESVRVFPENNQLVNELEDNIIKAIVQAFELSLSIDISDSKKISSKPNNFLIILTYRNLYLGTGTNISEEFLEEILIKRFSKSKFSLSTFPRKNIFIMSIEEFDQLIAIQNNDEIDFNLEKFLLEIASTDENIQTRSFTFGQHLSKYLNKNLHHPFLDKSFRKTLDSVMSNLI